MLVHLAGTCRSLRFQMREILPALERLSEDYPPAAQLVDAVVVALGPPPGDQGGEVLRGTPADLERKALDALQDLDPDRGRQ